MTASTFSGLALLRHAIETAVKNARNDLCMSSHDKKCEVSNLKSKLAEEKARLKYMNRKLSEKTDSHVRARQEYDYARGVCVNARQNEGIVLDANHISAHKIFVRNCEVLEKSWAQNLELAEARRNSWEFKARRQTELITKMTANLEDAEKLYRDSCAEVDNNIANLESVMLLLAQL
ncbi:hypothetical protein M758_11G092000 [Ceratodon purpureus]|nr:hypothetical protein M758_11G092000 [Ceratodon purpureus]